MAERRGGTREGDRGLARGRSLAKLLEEHRCYRNQSNLPRLTVRRILTWADKHYRLTGSWPTALSGEIVGSAGEDWRAIDRALHRGARGLQRDSLAELLARKRGYRNVRNLPRLTIRQILAWADEHYAEHGCRPTVNSGPIGATGETWAAVNDSLAKGFRPRGFRGAAALGPPVCYAARVDAASRSAQAIRRWRMRPVLKWVTTVTCLTIPVVSLYSAYRFTQWRSEGTRLTVTLGHATIAFYWTRPEYLGKTSAISGWCSSRYGGGWASVDECLAWPELVASTTDHGLRIPLWVAFACALVMTVLLWWMDGPAPRYGKCRCGYDLTGNSSGICPECGIPITPPV